MATIAILADNEFEDSELSDPMAELRKAGHTVVVLGKKAGETITGKNGKVSVKLDDAVDARRPEEFDALLLPGGHSPDTLRTHQPAIDFLKAFCKTGRPVAAICHGPQLLIETGLVEGMEMTSVENVKTDLINAGAKWRDEEVVTHSYLITSRTPKDLPAFNAAFLEAISQSAPASHWTTA